MTPLEQAVSTDEEFIASIYRWIDNLYGEKYIQSPGAYYGASGTYERCAIGAWFDGTIGIDDWFGIGKNELRLDDLFEIPATDVIMITFDSYDADWSDIGDIVSTFIGHYEMGLLGQLNWAYWMRRADAP